MNIWDTSITLSSFTYTMKQMSVPDLNSLRTLVVIVVTNLLVNTPVTTTFLRTLVIVVVLHKQAAVTFF
jgi:hypothetical protein